MEILGVLAAILSSALGGTAVGATRFLAGTLDPLTIGAVRFSGGFLVLAAVALWRRDRWPAKRDWLGAGTLGLLFFGLFPVLFNGALVYTTAARGALALSTLPLLTMLAGAVLRIEPPTMRKIVGVLIAMAGWPSRSAPAWRPLPKAHGAATSSWSRRRSAWRSTACGHDHSCRAPRRSRSWRLAWAWVLSVSSALAASNGGLTRLAALNAPQWIASGYLAIVCGAFIFFLWALRIETRGADAGCRLGCGQSGDGIDLRCRRPGRTGQREPACRARGGADRNSNRIGSHQKISACRLKPLA